MTGRATQFSIQPTPPPWDVQRGVLGKLPDSDQWRTHLPALRRALARVLLLSGGDDLLFIGRSPEPLYYYLQGLLDGISVDWRVTQLNVSLRFADLTAIHRATLRSFFTAHELAVPDLVRLDRRLCLCDVVHSGSTFSLLGQVLGEWADETQRSRALHARVRFLALTHQESSPWYAQPNLARFQRLTVRLDWPLWDYLGNRAEQVATHNPPEHWTAAPQKSRDEARLRALAEARALLQVARTRAEREAFIRAVHAQGGQRSEFLRHLALHWRGKARLIGRS